MGDPTYDAPVATPGRLLASGRDSDIFEYGPGLVLRRSREGRSMEVDARTMAFVRDQGYPAPAVDELRADGTELVMERIEGPTMLGVLGRRPWQLRSLARLLADLHDRLHAIAAPPWVGPAPGAPGTALLHLDLHPLNVLLGPKGPIVIDWPNAKAGDPATDVAITWALLAAAEIPASPVKAALLGRFRSALIGEFLRPFSRGSVAAQLPAVVAYKTEDPRMGADELAAMRRLVETEGA